MFRSSIAIKPALRSLLRGLAAFALVFGSYAVYAANPTQRPDVLAPSCKNPAPLHGQWQAEAPGYIVVLKEEVKDAAKVTAQLEKSIISLRPAMICPRWGCSS